MELTWDAPEGEVTGYQVLRRNTDECGAILRRHVENTNITDTRWMDTDVEIGTRYEYSVIAINDAGAGHRSHFATKRMARTVIAIAYVSGGGSEMAFAVNHLERDDDPDTVDYTLRGDVTLNVDGSDADACEGDGLGDDIHQFNVIDEVAEDFSAAFGGPGCNAGTYTLTFVLTDRNGEAIGTFRFRKEVVQGGQMTVIAASYLAISGTPMVGEALTAETSGISDDDGLDNVTYSYQWIRSDGATDFDIDGATSSSYLVTAADVGKTIKVRVSFTDDGGNDETRTSDATSLVEATVPGAPRDVEAERGGTGELDVSWDTPASNGGSPVTGYTVQWKEASGSWDTAEGVSSTTVTATSYTIAGLSLGTEYTVRVFATNSAGDGPASGEASSTTPNSPATGSPAITGAVWVGETLIADTAGISDADGLANAAFTYQWLRSDGTTDTDITGATGSTYTLVSVDEGKTIKVRVSFTDDAGNEETLTSTATAAVEAALTAELQGVPDSHDGSGTFIFRILFSEPVDVGFTTLKEHAFQVSNATIKKAQRVDGRDDLRKFTVQPSSDADVVLVLPATGDCATEGAICTSDGKRLSTRLEITVPGPAPANSAATGTPAISGTLEAGQTLTASTSGISDADGLTNATFGYQWIANDGTADTDIQDATASTYTLTDADAGKTIKVRVSFTDDAGNDETLTSTATDAVEAAPAPNSPATGAPTITGAAQVGETLTASTSGIEDDDGLDSATFSFQWLADDTDIAGATGSSYTLTDSDEGKAIRVKVSFTDDVGNEETLPSAATAVVASAPTPLTAQFLDTPSSHDGQAAFTFEMRFSEEFGLSYKTLRDHVFTVTGGEVTEARRLEQGSNVRWEIHVQPDGNGSVTVVLPVTTDCDAPGAVCTADGRMMSNRTELTVNGPGQ